MNYLQKQMELLKFDQRLVNINLKRGNVSQDELNAYLQTIPDSEKNAVNMDLESDDDQYDSESEGTTPETI